MSFPRANIKRFNDGSGCAPPPGTYNPKANDKLQGGVLDTTNRFKESKASAPLNESTASAGKTPVKQLFAVPQSSVKKSAKPSGNSSADATKIRELEQEVRKLCKERTEKEKVLTLKEEELKKLDGKLHSAVSERNSLQAKLVSLEKGLKEVKTANELLKSKVSSSSQASKKQDDLHHELCSVKQQLAGKDQEISVLKQDLTHSWSFLSNTVDMFEMLTSSLEVTVETYRYTVGELNKTNVPVDQKKNCKTLQKKSSETDISSSLKDGTIKIDNKIKLCKKKSEAIKSRFNEAISTFETTTKTLKEKYSSVLSEHECLVKDLEQTKNQLKEALENKKLLEQHKDSLQSDKCDLEKTTVQLTDKCKETEENHGALLNQIDDLAKTKEDIQTQLCELQKAYELSQSESINRLKQLEDREVLMGDTTKTLHERTVELQAENEDLVATLKETGELLSKTKEHNMELEDMINETEQKWDSDKKQFLVQIEDLVFEKSRTESQLSEAEEKIKSVEVNLDAYKAESEAKIQILTAELDLKKSELLQLQDKLGNLVYEKSKLHTEIGNLEAQMKLIKSTSEQTKVEAEKALEVVPELMARLEVVNSEKTAVEANIIELKQENANLQKTLETFQADFDDYVKQADQDRLEAQEKLMSQLDEIDGLKEQRDQMASNLDEWLTDKSVLDIEVAKQQCRIKVLEMEAEQTKQDYEEALKNQEAMVDKVKQEKCQIEKDMEQYGIDLLSNAAQLQTIQTQLKSKNEEHATLETKCNRLEESLSQSQQDLLAASQTISELKEAYTSKERDYEQLLEDTDSLEEDHNSQRDVNEDLQSQVEQIRADFIKRCLERDELVKNNEAKDKSLAVLSSQVSSMSLEKDSLTETLTQKTSQCEQLSKDLSEKDAKLSLSLKQISNYKQQIEDYLEHLQLKCEECEELQLKCEELDSELTISAQETVDLNERVESITRENTEKNQQLSDMYEAQMEELKAQVSSATASTEMEEEMARYKSLYEELQAKVEPFMEQIEAFELEKQSLLGMTMNTKAEMDKLSTDYARLLGHQNQKQKIKHIMKIKEENCALKNETQQLRAQVSKQKQTIKKLEEKTNPKRFDPTKAFSSKKENVTQSERPKTPLKDSNRK